MDRKAHGQIKFPSRKPGPSRVLPAKRAAEEPATPSRETRRPAVQVSPPDQHARQPQHAESLQEGLVMMILDIVEESGGRFHLWGVTREGRSVLVRVNDFQPYFYIPAPLRQAATEGHVAEDKTDLSIEACVQLQRALNRVLPPDSQVEGFQAVHRTPIMYYRPTMPLGSEYLQVCLRVGASARKASAAVHSAMQAGKLRAAGWVWREQDLYEADVNVLQRFLVDASVSGGSWVHIPPAAPPGSPPSAKPGFQVVPSREQLSLCSLEVLAPWRALQGLTPDATQLADPAWRPAPHMLPGGPSPGDPPRVSAKWEEALQVALEGHIAALRLMSLDVVAAPADGKDRVPNTANGDPIIAISCVLYSSHDVTSGGAAPPSGLGEGDEDDEEGEELFEGGAQAATEQPGANIHTSGEKVVFCWSGGEDSRSLWEGASGADVRVFRGEAAMLVAWQEFLAAADPDALAVFQVKETLGALAERFQALRLGGSAGGGPGLRISRLRPERAPPLSLKRVTMYSAAWVRSQSRMASTSNQETFRADVEGRLVFDILRQVLTTGNLASYSLVDCAQSLLGQRLEVLPGPQLAGLAGLAPPPGPLVPLDWAAAAPPLAEQRGSRLLRLARYSLARVGVVVRLLRRMATIPETLELARATGLTYAQALYNAQMIRTWSLLLRNARRLDYIISGRVDPAPLTESPYLIHPVEARTTGLYRTPVAVLDFASLYPSLYRAYNLCYTTLVHPADAGRFAPDALTTTPTGALFVKPEVRPGILPGILGALISARAQTREALKHATSPAAAAVLDSRQKALKVTANALYGFTGAQASPLQCLPLADSCLALGAASTRRAHELTEQFAREGRLGERGRDGKVIYAQTDSLFVSFPSASTAEAIQLGRAVARAVTEAFPQHMELKFERVCRPFMLLHVNRYAGRGYETAEEAESGPGTLVVKGIKSMWRQAAPIVGRTLQGALQRIIMHDDVPGAVKYVEGEIRRLLSGRCELWEFIMTGGLWRVTGQEVAAAAVSSNGIDEEAPSPASARGGQAGGGAGGRGGASGAAAAAAAAPPEVRGPHAALAVRLQQRDPGRTFVLGERLQYVLLPGYRTQDEAAEDPRTAALAGLMPDTELYWRNKLHRPLSEIFATCLSATALQSLLNGQHTMVRVDPLVASSSPGTRPDAGRKKGAGGRQTGLTQFFRNTPKCLACKRALPMPPATAAARRGGSAGAGEEDEAVAPGLCESCRAEDGRWQAVYLELLLERNALEKRRGAAVSYCAACHSGGAMGPVACENGECPVFHVRTTTLPRLTALQQSLARLDW